MLATTFVELFHPTLVLQDYPTTLWVGVGTNRYLDV